LQFEAPVRSNAHPNEQKFFGSLSQKKELLAFALRESGSMPIGINCPRGSKEALSFLKKRNKNFWLLGRAVDPTRA